MNISFDHTNRRTAGFTIVELLVVIVVISILAAITVVAYGNVQGRTHDSIIQEDLQKFGKTVEMMKVENDEYPGGSPGGGFSMNDFLSEVTSGPYAMHFSTGSYGAWLISGNATYDRDGRIAAGVYRAAGRTEAVCLVVGSKSGTKFVYTTPGGVTNLGKVTLTSALDASEGSYRDSCVKGGLSQAAGSGMVFTGVRNVNDL